MKAFFKIDLDLTVPADWTTLEMKIALAEWAQEHDIKIEGLVRQVISLDVRDTDYIRIV